MCLLSLAQLVNLLDIHLTAFGVQVLPIMTTGGSLPTTHISYLPFGTKIIPSIFREGALPDVLLFHGCALGPSYPWSTFWVAASSRSNPGFKIFISNIADNFCLTATHVINGVADLQDQVLPSGSRYCTCTEWGGQFQARSGFFPFCMWSKIIEFLEQGLCASRSHGSHPTCLHLAHLHLAHHGLRLAQVSSLEEELLGLYI